MGIFVFSLVLAVAALIASAVPSVHPALKYPLRVLVPFILIAGIMFGSSITVPASQTGVVIKHFGPPLLGGHIVAANGEQGPQAALLGPGWHFGYWPGMYEIEMVDVLHIDYGSVGFVTASDGKPLPEGETFAPAWSSVEDMLDPEKFLNGSGYRGPQSSVLPPGTYRYNPRLHKIDPIPALQVEPGTVAVIKANTGKIVDASGAGELMVNGVPLVNEGERGIWRKPLTPGAYYLNTNAFNFTLVKTTNRVYTYQSKNPSATTVTGNKASAEEWSVVVRSQDGFTFPVDVRVSCAVHAEDAPYLVALLGNPDQVTHDAQEDEDLETLEARIILPAIRAIFRNVAEGMNALEFVKQRSQVEKVASDRMRVELEKFHINLDEVFVGNVHLDASEAGLKLLTTQTDREVAVNQQTLYAEQQKAELARASYVKAQEEAEQQRNLAQATYAVLVSEQKAKARAAEAKGESDYQIITGEGRAKAYEAMVRTLGQAQVAQLELLKLVADGKIQPGAITPQVLVVGSGAGTMDALAGTILRQAAQSGTTAPAPQSANSH